MPTNAQEKDRSLDEKLADLILEAFPMPQADPKRKMPLVGLYMTDPAHPVVRQLYDEFKRTNGIPVSYAMTDRERLLFDLSLLALPAKRLMFLRRKARIEARNEAITEATSE